MADVAVGGLESAVPAAGGKPDRFPCFDGLRAIAALSVLVTHVSFLTYANVEHPLGVFFARMDIGVAFFFLISGFLLYRPFAMAHLTATAGPAVRPFFRRRVLRIFPAYWVALTVVVLVSADATIPDLKSGLLWYSLLHIYSLDHVIGPISQSWSLGTEISFYLLLPLYAAFMARRGRTPATRLRAEVIGLVALYVASVVFRVVVFATHVSEPGMLKTWLPATTDYFALGMGLAVASGWLALHPGRVPLGLDRPWAPAVCWGAAALSFWTVSTRIGLPLIEIDYEPWQDMLRQLLYGATGLFLLLPAVFGPQEAGVIRRFLRARVIVLLGLISYGIYLYQNLWLEQFLRWRDLPDFTGPFGQTLAAVVALTVASAAVSYVVVERPALARKA